MALPDDPNGNVRDYRLNHLEKELGETREDIQRGFSDLNEKLDSRFRNRDKKYDDHEGRLRTVEKSQWRSSGIAGVLGAIGTALLGWVLGWFRQPS